MKKKNKKAVRMYLLHFWEHQIIKNGIYYLDDDDKKESPVKFVQEYSIKKHCSGWGKNDEIMIFLTEKARKQNWEDSYIYKEEYFDKTEINKSNIDSYEVSLSIKKKTHRDGLGTILDKMESIREIKKDIDIPDGKNTQEIWDIFNIIIKSLNKDKYKLIVFDITHAFRSLPMLMIILINYLRAYKDIGDVEIYYGAFEAKNPDVKPLQAPIFELSEFVTLLDWADATNNFIKNGVTKDITGLISSEIKPLCSKEEDRKANSKSLKSLENCSKKLNEFSSYLSTSNLKQILENKNLFQVINNEIDSIETETNNLVVALKPLLKRIKLKINKFNTDEYINKSFASVEWCIEHDLIQQGITIFVEFLISYFLYTIDEDVVNDQKYIRPNKSKEFNCNDISNSECENQKKDLFKEYKNKIRNFIKQDSRYKDLVKNFQSIKENRNKINHACMRKEESEAEKFEDCLEKKFKQIKKIINELENTSD